MRGLRSNSRLHIINTIIISLILLIGAGGVIGVAQADETSILAKSISAALAVGLAGLGAGFAVGMAGAAVASGIVEKREATGALLLIVVLGEGIAIYGFLIALLLILIV
ncbi:MAG: hypothetical protein QXE99_01800 [Acidilobaceae archaeon]